MILRHGPSALGTAGADDRLRMAGRRQGRVLAAHDRPTGPLHKTRSAVMARHGMAATSQPLATAAAIRVLQQGGNAVDAAIAANAVLGVVEPMSCGIGGDLFAIVWDAKTQKLYGLNASGRSPDAATLEFFQSKGLEADPRPRPAELVGPRLRRRLGPAPHAGSARGRWPSCSRRRSPTPRTASPSARSSPPTGKGRSRGLAGGPDLRRLLPARRPGPRGRRRLPQPRRSPGRSGPSPRAAATPSTEGPIADAIVAYSQSGRAACSRSEDFAEPHQHLGRAGLDQLPRLRRLGAAPQRPGDRRPPDAQPARAVRPQEHGARARPRRST